jgi:Ran GTPase-activating protein (RanGAP) involved in mRNA processing and transport
LELGDNQLMGEGVRAISSSLKENRILRELNLRSNGIDDLGAGSIAETLTSNHTLTKLDLQNNIIENRGALAIAAALKVLFFFFFFFNLTPSRYPVPHSAFFFGWKKPTTQVNGTLRILNLRFNNIGDSGVTPIGAALQINQSLQELDLGGNK